MDKKMRMQSAYFNPGNRTDFAFVFSAPGKIEKKEKQPVRGTTGNNLELLLKMLKLTTEKDGRDARYKFRITNSYKIPVFKEQDNRTEAQLSKIKNPKNLQRLFNELSDITAHIICFGKKAQLAIMEIQKLRERMIPARHLSLQSLNQIKKDVTGKPIVKGQEGNTLKRLEVIKYDIARQMKKNL